VIPFHKSGTVPPAPDLPRAACRDHPTLPPEVWTDPPATNHPQNTQARAVCATCPERLPCWLWAQTWRPTAGIWAGQLWGTG
jgi:hypothetical protein